jgi:hypothetical protein
MGILLIEVFNVITRLDSRAEFNRLLEARSTLHVRFGAGGGQIPDRRRRCSNGSVEEVSCKEAHFASGEG